MKLSEYFETKTGTSVLATADDKGIVNVAIYSRPHFMDEETIAFIMADKRTHHNLESNPHAAYLFTEARIVKSFLLQLVKIIYYKAFSNNLLSSPL
jgi:hypothetical protein